MQSWKTLARSTVFDHSKYLKIEQHTIELPDGRIIQDWPWIITPDYVNIAVLTTEGMFLCFRQTKYAIPETSLAPVGGYLEPGEEPLATAQRELQEETGYQASEWVNLGSYAVDGNRGAGVAHLFLACDARRVSDPHEADLEEQEMLLLQPAQVAHALSTGEFKVVAWATVMALALLHIQTQVGKNVVPLGDR